MAPDPVLEEQEEIALSNTDGDEELPEMSENFTRMSQEFQKGKEKQEAAEVKKFKIKIGGRQFN